ncbi:acyl-CoA N-acyltransferase [Mycotypha africana]|uniref:acyl-CoA N-acyltransferase n=1 Tax=Mycotypha africana TaxID=64632 RepID=UPI00230012F6|nr:acyl-CoA N-acyltransferase [Mycotypha africana]KAI8967377.1 acyl-CoA N-acyltransferase [Mycotypha africana]
MSRIDLGDITRNNLGQVRVLHKTLFPVEYKDNFYNELLEAGEFAKLAYCNDVCVGTVCCRKEFVDEQVKDKFKIYMMTLGVLDPYRHLGIGTKMVQHILEQAKSSNITQVYLHVQINNTEAVDFYKKNGFDIISTEQDYYKNITPRDAYLLAKNID